MDFSWVDGSNPVAVWWMFLIAVASANILAWIALHRSHRRGAKRLQFDKWRAELMLWLCAAYVFRCAFRSALPRADVQRIALFDSWISSIFVGRSVATIAEICFIIQWAIVLRYLANVVKSDTVRNVAHVIVPLIVLAECFSWYAVVTTSFIGNSVENSLWAVAFFLIAVALVRLLSEFHGIARVAIVTCLAGIAGYLAFLVLIDVPMYFARWQADLAAGREPLGLLGGMHDVATRWTVTHDVAHWRDEMAWMGLYFSAGVWSSLSLCGFSLVRHRVRQYRTFPASGLRGARLPLGARLSLARARPAREL